MSFQSGYSRQRIGDRRRSVHEATGKATPAGPTSAEMNGISSGSRCFLTVVLVACAYFVGSGARATDNGGGSGTFSGASASAYAGAGALSGASASTGAFAGTGNIPGAHDGHKGIRSYDNTGFSHDNDDNRRTKSYGAPSGHDAGNDHGIKGGGHGYNKNDDGCSKCKWENDDYWERDEPEEERDENDGDECDDGDDGQYKPDKTHHHGGPGRGHKPGSRPPGVHKTGPTGVYGDDGVKGGGRPGGPPGNVNYPASTGYTGPISGFGTTPRPGSTWNTPFAGASKPGYGGVTPSGTTPSSWDRGTTPSGFGFSTKSAWISGHDGAPTGSFGTTPTPGTSWNTGAQTQRPGQGWNTGFVTPTAGFPTSQKPAPGWNAGATSKPGQGWNAGFDGPSTGGFPSSQKPEAPWNSGRDGGSFGTTPKPGQSWNTGLPGGKPGPSWDHGTAPVGTSGCTRPDSSCNQGQQVPVKVGPVDFGPTKDDKPLIDVSLAPPHPGSNVFSPGSYGSTKGSPNGPYGQPGTQSTSAYAGASVTPGIGSTFHGVPNLGKKDHPFGFNKPADTQTPHVPYGGQDQTYSNTGSDAYNPGNAPDYNKPGHGSGPHGTWSSSVASTFGTTKGPYGGITSPGIVPGAQGNTFSPGKSPGYPTGSDVYGQPGVTKPSYGSASTWSGGSQAGSGSTTWHDSGTTGPHVGFPGSSTGFGTTKTPFGYASTSSPTPFGGSYGGAGPKQPGFNFASSSASASAGTSVFGTSPRPDITGGITSVYSTVPTYGGSSNYPGIKGFPGSTRPPYGTVPHGTHSDAGTAAWPGKQPGSDGGTWPGGHPGAGSGITPAGQSGSDGRPWPGQQPGSGITPTYGGGSGYPGIKGSPGSTRPSYGSVPHGIHPDTGTGAWPGKHPGAESGIVPEGQPGREGRPWPGKQPGSDTAPTYGGTSSYPGIKDSFGNTRPPYGTVPHGTHPNAGTGAWPGKQPGSDGGTWPGGHPGAGSGIAPGGRPGSEGRPWPSGKPGDGSKPWSSGQPGSGSTITPGLHPGAPSGNWPEGQPGSGSGSWSGGQPGHGSGIRPGEQPGRGSGSGCQNVNCGGATGPLEGSSNCGGGDYYCGGGCSGGGNNAPVTHGLCGGVSGPSGVNKTYYPAGTGDGNVPSIGNAYGPNTPFNTGIGAYPGINTRCESGDNSCNQGGDASITPEGPVKWNPANPFLYGTGGGTPSDVSRPWSETTVKPIGKGNPFLDSNWNSPRPGYSGSNINNDRNAIPHREDSNKPIGQGNPFLDNSKRRGDINPNEGVIPLGGKKPESNNPFTGPVGSGGSGPGGPPYGGRPAGSPGSGTPESGDYGGVKDGFYPGGVSPQGGNNDGFYPPGGNPQGPGPLQCKLGIFGCGTSGSGSYTPTKGGKHPGGVFGGNPGNIPGGPGNPGTGPVSGHFGAGAGYPGSGGGNFAGSVGGAQAGAYAGSFSNAQASSSSFASAKSLSFSGAAGPGNDFGQTQSGSWPPSGRQSQGGSNPWASSGAGAFASSSSGSWSGNSPTNVKG